MRTRAKRRWQRGWRHRRTRATELRAHARPGRGARAGDPGRTRPIANGWATPFPYDPIEVTAVPPIGEQLIGNTSTGWSSCSRTNTRTSSISTARPAGWRRAARVRARPGAVPQPVPAGLADRGNGDVRREPDDRRGRIPAGDFRQSSLAAAAAWIRAARSRGGGLDDLPAATRIRIRRTVPSLSRRHLRRRQPAAVDGRDRPAPAVPGVPGVSEIFGRSLGGLWSDFAADARTKAPQQPDAARRLTRHGFSVAGPRFAADGRSTTRSPTRRAFRR